MLAYSTDNTIVRLSTDANAVETRTVKFTWHVPITSLMLHSAYKSNLKPSLWKLYNIKTWFNGACCLNVVILSPVNCSFKMSYEHTYLHRRQRHRSLMESLFPPTTQQDACDCFSIVILFLFFLLLSYIYNLALSVGFSQLCCSFQRQICYYLSILFLLFFYLLLHFLIITTMTT